MNGCSNFRLVPLAQKALAAGFCDYFVKPIMEIEQFRQAVYSHIGKCANLQKKDPAA